VDLGSIIIRIQADTSGLREIEQAASRISASLENLVKSLDTLTQAVERNTAAINKSMGDMANNTSQQAKETSQRIEEISKSLFTVSESAKQSGKAMTDAFEGFSSEGIRQSRLAMTGLERFQFGVRDAFSSIRDDATNTAGFVRRLFTDVDFRREFVGKIQAGMHEASQSLRKMGAEITRMGRAWSKTLTAPLVLLGTAAFEAARQVDAALNIIAIRTGETGYTLAGLQGSFREVGKGSASSLVDVGKVMAELHRRLKIEGTDLEGLSAKMLDASRMMDESAQESAVTFSQMARYWTLGADEYDHALEKMFYASQQSGLGLVRLQMTMTELGPLLKVLGYDFDQATAFITQMYEAGMEIDQLSYALRSAFKVLQEKGLDPKAHFGVFVQGIKDATDEMEALTLATEIFGSGMFGGRAAAVMSDAIRKGTLDLDDTVDQLRKVEDAIGRARAESWRWDQEWARFKNQIAITLEPLGRTLMDISKGPLATFLEKLQQGVDAFNSLEPSKQEALAKSLSAIAVAGPGLLLAGAAVGLISSLLTPQGAIAAGIVGIGLAILWLATTSDESAERIKATFTSLAKSLEISWLSVSWAMLWGPSKLGLLTEHFDWVDQRIKTLNKDLTKSVAVMKGLAIPDETIQAFVKGAPQDIMKALEQEPTFKIAVGKAWGQTEAVLQEAGVSLPDEVTDIVTLLERIEQQSVETAKSKKGVGVAEPSFVPGQALRSTPLEKYDEVKSNVADPRTAVEGSPAQLISKLRAHGLKSQYGPSLTEALASTDKGVVLFNELKPYLSFDEEELWHKAMAGMDSLRRDKGYKTDPKLMGRFKTVLAYLLRISPLVETVEEMMRVLDIEFPGYTPTTGALPTAIIGPNMLAQAAGYTPTTGALPTAIIGPNMLAQAAGGIGAGQWMPQGIQIASSFATDAPLPMLDADMPLPLFDTESVQDKADTMNQIVDAAQQELERQYSHNLRVLRDITDTYWWQTATIPGGAMHMATEDVLNSVDNMVVSLDAVQLGQLADWADFYAFDMASIEQDSLVAMWQQLPEELKQLNIGYLRDWVEFYNLDMAATEQYELVVMWHRLPDELRQLNIEHLCDWADFYALDAAAAEQAKLEGTWLGLKTKLETIWGNIGASLEVMGVNWTTLQKQIDTDLRSELDKTLNEMVEDLSEGSFNMQSVWKFLGINLITQSKKDFKTLDEIAQSGLKDMKAAFNTFAHEALHIWITGEGDIKATFLKFMGNMLAIVIQTAISTALAGKTLSQVLKWMWTPWGAVAIAGALIALSAIQASYKKQMSEATAMATGGIVTSPTLALIGEAGPEAVIPLGSSKANAYMGSGYGDITINNNIKVDGNIDDRNMDVLARKVQESTIESLRRMGITPQRAY